jgi:uncharacterized SAM-binding protein YcdF (DUF218 family)
MKRRCRWIGLGLTVAACVALYAARVQVLPWAARWLDVGRPPASPADYVYILGGGTGTRELTGAVIFKQGWAGGVLITHVAPSTANEIAGVPLYHDLARRFLLERGVPNDAIGLVGRQCQTTYDEARSLRAWLDDHPTDRIIVVTDFYHTRRARWIMQRMLGPARERVSFTSSPSDSFDANNWWRNEIGFRAIPNEYAGLVYYWLRYGWLGYALVATASLWIAWRFVRHRRRAASEPTEALPA